MRKLLAIVILLLASQAWGATYYMRADGSAANKGAASGPCGTVGNAMNVAVHNGETFAAGDVITLCDDGGVFRTTITPPSSGSAGNVITYNASGNPKVSGADLVAPGTSWSQPTLTFGWLEGVGGQTTDLGTGAVMCSGLDAPALSGAVSAITIDIANADSTADIKVGLYTNNAGVPGTKVGTEEETTNHATFSREWHDFPYTASVTGGTDYWICMELSAAGDWTNGYTVSGGTNKYNDTNTYGDAWPSSFTNNTSSAANLAVYAKYSPNNVWSTALTTEPVFILFDNVLGRRENVGGIAALTAAGDWYWLDNVLYIYSATDPDTAYTNPGVEVSQRGTVLSISGKDYLTLDGIDYEMSNTTEGSVSLMYVNDSAGTTLTNFNAKYSYYFLLWAKTATGDITDLTISNADMSIGGNGIGIYGIADHSFSWSGLEIDNVVVHDISNWSANFPNDARTNDVDREGMGINGYGDSSDIWIHDIEIYNVGASTNSNNICLYLYQDMDAIVERFNIHDCGRIGIAIEDGAGAYGHDLTIRYGLLYNNGNTTITSNEFSGGITVVSANAAGLDNVNIYNNVIYNNGGSATDNDAKRGGLLIYSYAPSANDAPISVKNNIIYNNATYDLHITEVTAAFTGLDLNYNLIYRPSGNMIVNDGNTYDYSQFSTYKTASGYDANSVNADPLFVSTVTPDFHLQSGSPAINEGVDVGLTTDYDGNTVPRGAAPDIGAYEWADTPLLISPAQNAAGLGFPIEFVWEGFYGAVSYEMQVDDNSDFSSPEMDIFTDDTTVEGDDTDGLKLGTHYYWRVRAVR